jgi:type IV pilus assembly protein PilV
MLMDTVMAARANSALNLPKKLRGGSLIEVLVSLVLVAFGFLGLGGLFNYSISANKNASSRLVATLLAQDYAEMVRANPDGFLANAYDRALGTFDPAAKSVTALDTTKTCSFGNCNTATKLAQNDQELFKQRLKATLTAGSYQAAKIATANTYTLDIWIVWVEGQNVTSANSSNDVCPTSLTTAAPAPDPYPRCLYVRVAL